jgi:hypothetical protein
VSNDPQIDHCEIDGLTITAVLWNREGRPHGTVAVSRDGVVQLAVAFLKSGISVAMLALGPRHLYHIKDETYADAILAAVARRDLSGWQTVIEIGKLYVEGIAA